MKLLNGGMNVMRLSYESAATKSKESRLRGFSMVPLLIALLVLIGIVCAYLLFVQNALKEEMNDYSHTLSSIGAWLHNVEELEGMICDSSTSTLKDFPGLGDVLREPAAAELETERDKPHYPLIVYSKKYYWSLEADAKTSVSEAKAKEVLAQMTPEERSAALTDGKIDLAKYGIDFSDQKQKVAVALERHFLNTLRKVAESG